MIAVNPLYLLLTPYNKHTKLLFIDSTEIYYHLDKSAIDSTVKMVYEDNSYDLCIFLDSQHDYRINNFYNEVLRVLRKDGTLLYFNRDYKQRNGLKPFTIYNKCLNRILRAIRKLYIYSKFKYTFSYIDQYSINMNSGFYLLSKKCLSAFWFIFTENRTGKRSITITCRNLRKKLSSVDGICLSNNYSNQNMIYGLLDYINSTTSFSCNFEWQQDCIITNKGTVVIPIQNKKTETDYILKIALNEKTISDLSANYKNVFMLKNSNTINLDFKNKVPDLVLESSYEGLYFTVEKKVGSCSAIEFVDNRTCYASILANATNAIEGMHFDTKQNSLNNDSVVEMLISERIAYVMHNANSSDLSVSKLQFIEKYLLDTLLSVELPLVFHKGDCSVNNVLVDIPISDKCYFIDWDCSSVSFLPLIDTLSLMESFCRYKKKINLGTVLIEKYLTNSFSVVEKQIIDSYLRRINISSDLVRPLIIFYWLDHVYSHGLMEDYHDNYQWAKYNVYNVIDHLASHLS